MVLLPVRAMTARLLGARVSPLAAFSTEATDAAAAALRMVHALVKLPVIFTLSGIGSSFFVVTPVLVQGFKKSRRGADDVADVETTGLAVVPELAASKVAVAPPQPLWLSQTRDTTDLSAFAPKIVVVGVGGAGGNAGACSCIS